MRHLTAILFLAAGCVGSVGPSQGDDDDGGGSNDPPPVDPRPAKEIFKADVHPALMKCSGNACHETTATSSALSKFYNPDGEQSYTATVASTTLVGTFSSIAPILTHVQAGHKGLSYTPDETTKITGWLLKETTERAAVGGGGGGPPPPPPYDPKKALAEWSGCLTQENFNAAGMTGGWANLAADNLQKCINCHVGGIAGFYISTNSTNFFTAISTTTAYMLKYFSVDVVNKKVVVNTGSFEAANRIVGHPTFPVLTNAGMIALKKLYDTTLARKTANTCDPPRLKD